MSSRLVKSPQTLIKCKSKSAHKHKGEQMSPHILHWWLQATHAVKPNLTSVAIFRAFSLLLSSFQLLSDQLFPEAARCLQPQLFSCVFWTFICAKAVLLHPSVWVFISLFIRLQQQQYYFLLLFFIIIFTQKLSITFEVFSFCLLKILKYLTINKSSWKELQQELKKLGMTWDNLITQRTPTATQGTENDLVMNACSMHQCPSSYLEYMWKKLNPRSYFNV